MDKSQTDIQLEKATDDFGEFLDKLEPGNPVNIAELETQSSKLLSAMNHSARTRFDDVDMQCVSIGTTIIKLELHFIRLTEHFIKLTENSIKLAEYLEEEKKRQSQ